MARTRRDTPVDLGFVAYRRYCQAVSVRGSKRHYWENLSARDRRAWRLAAIAVVDALEMDECLDIIGRHISRLVKAHDRKTLE